MAIGFHDQVKAALIDPTDAPPDNNTPDYLLIDGTTQAKSGILRLGTGDLTPPFIYQLEVLGEGAVSTSAVIDQNLKVSKTQDTLFVDAANSKVCVGPCLNVAGTKLEVSGGTWSMSTIGAPGLSANSSGAEAIYGVNSFIGFGSGSVGPGIQGTSQHATSYGVRASSLATTAAQGQSGINVSTFNRVLLNDTVNCAGNWCDRTTAAGNSAVNDVISTAGGGILNTIGTAIYFGLSSPFKKIAFDMTYNNAGSGTVQWSYRNASSGWTNFSPTGAYNFNTSSSSQTAVTLWNTFPVTLGTATASTVTSNTIVDATSLYWVRATVTANFPSPRPFGNQITPGLSNAVYGYSTTGYGILASNINTFGLWAGYFSGRLEGSQDISGAKMVSTRPGVSLVSQAAGQVTASYAVGNGQVKNFDGTYLWYLSNDKLLKIRASDGFKIWETAVGANPTDAMFDGNNVWVTVSGTDQVMKINPADGSAACPPISLAAGSRPHSIVFDGQYYWVVASGKGDVVKINSSCSTVGTAVHLTGRADALTKMIYDGSHLWVLSPSENLLYNINPSTGYAYGSSGIVSSDTTDLFFDNYYFWVLNGTTQTTLKFSLSDSKQCAVQDPTTAPPSFAACTDDASCSNVHGNNLGSCLPFSTPSVFRTYALASGAAYAAFDGSYIWIANTTDQSLTRLNAGIPSDRTDFPLGFSPTGVVFDGTYLYVSGPAGITKILSGIGFGSVDLSRTLTLQNNNPLTAQTGSFNISGSGRIGGAMTAGGDLSAPTNVWDAVTAGDDQGDGVNPLGTGTYRCPAGHYIKNITTTGSNQVTKIECRGL